MIEEPPLKPVFDKAAEQLPPTDFAASLKRSFGADTAAAVLKTFEKLSLPAPEKAAEFIEGTAGPLLFLDSYGLIMRIEHKDTWSIVDGFDRVNDTPWVLRPLASLEAGNAIIEICPGCHTSEDNAEALALADKLRGAGVNFWDGHAANIGIVPVKAPNFPEGIHVVIDRGAVNRLAAGVWGVQRALEGHAAETAEADDLQQKLYKPLCDRFTRGWRGEVPMARFWDLCRKYKNADKLIAGWQKEGGPENSKKNRGASAGAVYEMRLQQREKSRESEMAVVNNPALRRGGALDNPG